MDTVLQKSTSQPQVSPQETNSEALTVMFDGACPLCRREVALYQSLAPLQTVSWLDVSKDTAGLSQIDQARYMARFHVQLPDGRVLSGAAAFVALWLVMPGWRWLGRIGRLPGVTPVLERAYRGFLHLRPYLQRWARIAESSSQR
jgi:predicted DCC family thiol-disulfide oxidoreductase YuxK